MSLDSQACLDAAGKSVLLMCRIEESYEEKVVPSGGGGGVRAANAYREAPERRQRVASNAAASTSASSPSLSPRAGTWIRQNDSKSRHSHSMLHPIALSKPVAVSLFAQFITCSSRPPGSDGMLPVAGHFAS